MLNPNVVLSQLRTNQKVEASYVYTPQKFPIPFLFPFILLGSVFILLCTILYGSVIIFLGEGRMISSSFWPIYTHYPLLILPPLLIFIFFPYLIWRLEKRNRDMILVLFPEGFIVYRHWRNEQSCQTRMVKYTDVRNITKGTSSSGITLNMIYNDGKREMIFLTTKSRDSLAIREKIVGDYFDFSRKH